jgi:hypothetical protein
MADDHAAARRSYRAAARRTTSRPEQRYLAAQAARRSEGEPRSDNVGTAAHDLAGRGYPGSPMTTSLGR